MYLNCKTFYSFRYGTFPTVGLVAHAEQMGIQSLALTNINNTCDALEFMQLCNGKGIKPILGVEVRNSDRLLYILIAANNNGFYWINHFISTHLSLKKDFPTSTDDKAFFDNPDDGFVIFPLGTKKTQELFFNFTSIILYGCDRAKHFPPFMETVLCLVLRFDIFSYNVTIG